METCAAQLPASTERLEEFQKAQAAECVCASTIHYCQKGWPEKSKIEADLRPYWKARGELTLGKNNLLLHGKWIVVPKSLQRQTLEKIHAGHQGVQRCRLCAMTSV